MSNLDYLNTQMGYYNSIVINTNYPIDFRRLAQVRWQQLWEEYTSLVNS